MNTKTRRHFADASNMVAAIGGGPLSARVLLYLLRSEAYGNPSPSLAETALAVGTSIEGAKWAVRKLRALGALEPRAPLRVRRRQWVDREVAA